MLCMGPPLLAPPRVFQKRHGLWTSAQDNVACSRCSSVLKYSMVVYLTAELLAMLEARKLVLLGAKVIRRRAGMRHQGHCSFKGQTTRSNATCLPIYIPASSVILPNLLLYPLKSVCARLSLVWWAYRNLDYDQKAVTRADSLRSGHDERRRPALTLTEITSACCPRNMCNWYCTSNGPSTNLKCLHCGTR